MEYITIQASKRKVIGKKVKALRREGKLPAVIYGHNIDPLPITLDMKEASRILAGLTSSTLLQIDLEGEEFTALVRDRQRDYLKGQFLHIDFQAVSMKDKIRAFVQVELTGTSPAVQEFNAIVEQQYNEIEIECLPGDLPESVVIDISELSEIGSQLYVKDLTFDGDVSVLTDLEETLVSITVPTSQVEDEVEEEEEAIFEAETADEPEVIERGKKEEEDF